jgi:hypothetical protein
MKAMRNVLTSLSIVLLSVGIALAQEDAEITGTVTDPTGAVVPGAQISLTNGATGEVRTAFSNASGLYDFPALHIGSYTLNASGAGFSRYTRTDIVLNVAETIREDVQLAVGSGNQTVTVQGDALQVQTETNEVSSLITGKQLAQLAVNGRNLVPLTTLGLGVSANIPAFNGIASKGSSFNISFNGNRPEHNVWLIDGGENYDRGSGGQINVMPTLDAIAEFQTLESNYSPDYGIGSGGMISMVLKSGTRDFHGALWEFNRNNAYDANYYFSKQSNIPTPVLRLNIFGGDIGGPIFIPHVYNTDRRKTFFFWSEEWRRYIQGQNPTSQTTIAASDFPTAGSPLIYTPPAGKAAPLVPATEDPDRLALYAEDGLTIGSPFPRNTIPANLIDPNATLLMNTGVIPPPNAANNQYVTSVKVPLYLREDVVRIDHDINDKLHFMAHYIHDDTHIGYAPPLWGDATFPTVGSVDVEPGWGAVVKLIQTLSPTLLNETAFNYNRDSNTMTPTGPVSQPPGWSASTYFTGNNALNKMPEVDLGSPENINYSSNYFPWFNAENDYQFRDDLSWTKGRHSLKFGFSYMLFYKNQQLQYNTQGTFGFTNAFSGDSYVNFLLGLASTFSQLQSLETLHYYNHTYSGYAVDNWHVLPRLVLNLGVRYDALPHVYELHNRLATFIPADYNASEPPEFNPDNSLNPNGPGFSQPPGTPARFYLNGMQLAGSNGFPRGLVKNSYGTVMPRVGFSYQLFGAGKTVVRGGFGLFFERIQGNDAYDAALNTPWAYIPSSTNIYFSNPSKSTNTGVIAGTPVFPSALQTPAYYYPPPAVAQFSLGIQQQITPKIVAVVQYVGSSGWHQDDDRPINTLPLDSPDRKGVATGTFSNTNAARIYPGYAGITLEENATNTSYNSLQAGLRTENWRGLTLQVAYTYSHEIDIASDDLHTISNPFNLNYDRGSGLYDRRNILNANYIYNVPFLLHSPNTFQRLALAGWQISGVTTGESGYPDVVTYSPNVLGLGGGSNRPNLSGSAKGPKKQTAWFNKNAFSAPVAPWNGGPNQGFGTAGKDAVVGPGFYNTNLSLFKLIPLTRSEGATLQLRLESFNVFNHTQFQNIDTGFTDSTFGRATSTYDPRVLQLGGKFTF